MFKCQFCGAQVPRGVSPKMVVTGRRDRVYSQKWERVRNSKAAKVRWTWRDLPKNKQGGTRHHKPRLIEVLVPGHVGWEITGEGKACGRCTARLP